MPRRNKREVYEPLDLTPAGVRPALWGQATMTTDPAKARQDRIRREVDRSERQRAARINNGIDWSVCLVPGCGEELFMWGMQIHSIANERDHTIALPLCHRHLTVAHHQANRDPNNELLVNGAARVVERKLERERAVHQTDKILRAADVASGHIYYVRLNGLVKVGWSRDVDQRLRAYGPDVDVLCIYAASRDDETHLHRQLRPVLAKGREWYQDCKVIADYVSRAVEEHGLPSWSDGWTTPKPVVAGKRHP